MKLKALALASICFVVTGRGGAEPATVSTTSGDSMASADNPELAQIFSEDQADRKPERGTPIDWSVVIPRDRAREARVKVLYVANQLKTGGDFFHAAMILQHSPQPEDYLLCHELCIAAIIKGNSRAPWLAAASEDRFLRSINRSQRFGTQFGSVDGGPIRLAPVEEGVTDSLRKILHVPTLAEAKAREAAMNPPIPVQNQSPDPTPPAVTPAAGQPTRQP